LAGRRSSGAHKNAVDSPHKQVVCQKGGEKSSARELSGLDNASMSQNIQATRPDDDSHPRRSGVSPYSP
jgi:hypothetical protein